MSLKKKDNISKKKKNNISMFFLYFSLLKKWGVSEKRNFYIANLLMLIVASTTALYPIVIDYAFNVISNREKNKIFIIPLLIISITFVKGFAYFYQTLFVGKIVNTIIKNIQVNLFQKLISLDILSLGTYKGGSLQSRFINDLNILKEAITRVLNNLVRDFFTLVGLLASMIYLDWALTLCVILIYPVALKPIILVGKRTRHISSKLQEKIAVASAFLNENFVAIREIKSFNLEQLQNLKSQKSFKDIYDNNINIIKTRAKIEPTLEIVGGLAISCVLVVAGLRILQGNSDIGSFTGFISALIIAVQPARALGTLNNVLQEGSATLLRLNDILSKKSEVVESNLPKKFKFSNSLKFKNVYFSYKTKDWVLKKINCEIKPFEKIALVGSNGSGKSTFINLISRFFDPVRGSIYIDGKNLKDIAIKQLRNKISLVSQDVILFNSSILNNIRLSQPKISEKNVREACMQADAHNFIKRLKNGYNTKVGDRGLNLSGGQRQKIAIARAILKKPKILLLDEATSALDLKSEIKTNKMLAVLNQNMTIILIAHRLESIAAADKVFFFKSGKLEAIGNHKDLIKKNSFYKDYFKRKSVK